MKFHLFKKSRQYCGRPYCGPASDNKPAEANDIYLAQRLEMELTNRNPVGFDIYDSETGEKVHFTNTDNPIDFPE